MLDHFSEDISNPIKCFRKFFYKKERLIDVTWLTDTILVTSSADGACCTALFCLSSLTVLITSGCYQLWNTNNYLDCSDPLCDYELNPDPVTVKKAHQKAINSLDYKHNQLITSSADKTIKLFDCKTTQLVNCLQMSCESKQVIFAPNSARKFAAACNDGVVRVFNYNENNQENNSCLELRTSANQQLNSLDWSKVNCNLLVTGSNQGAIVGYDIRNACTPLFHCDLNDNKITAKLIKNKKIKFHPFNDNFFATVNSDNTTRLFNCKLAAGLVDCDHIYSYKHHSDCVSGLDFNQLIRDELIDCGRDSMIYLYNITRFHT